MTVERGKLSPWNPEQVVPIVTYLASRACQSSRDNYSACAGNIYEELFGVVGRLGVDVPGSGA